MKSEKYGIRERFARISESTFSPADFNENGV
jgi:hypothetical protein